MSLVLILSFLHGCDNIISLFKKLPFLRIAESWLSDSGSLRGTEDSPESGLSHLARLLPRPPRAHPQTPSPPGPIYTALTRNFVSLLTLSHSLPYFISLLT